MRGKRRRAVDRIVEKVALQSRQRVIDITGHAELELDDAWAPILRSLRRRLAKAKAKDVPKLVQKATEELAVAAIEPATRSIQAGAQEGASYGARQASALVKPMAAPASARAALAPGLTKRRIRKIASDRISGRTAVGKVNLSRRLHTSVGEAGRYAAHVVQSSIAAREGVFEAAERFIEGAPQMRVPIPKYVREIVDAARLAEDSGDRTRLFEVVQKHRDQMERLGQGADRRDGLYTIRSTVREFVREVQIRPEEVERLVDRHLADRAQFQARRIIRHETGEAHKTAYRVSVREKPHVKGIRRVLSPAHPEPDVCDLLAAQNLFGLGPGGYPLAKVPETPHPGCLCLEVPIVDEHHFRRRLAERRGEGEPPRTWEDPNLETADEWLARQPDSFRKKLLGPTRARIFDDKSDRRPVIDKSGRPIPVGEVLGAASSSRGASARRLSSAPLFE